MITAARLAAALADRYRPERLLGEGGAATVWLSRDLKHDRWVALKVLRPEATGMLGPERFLKEVRLTAYLHHPHILPLFDSGLVEGLPFYVMPYVEGESLRARLQREGRLEVAEAVRLVGEVGDALGYAHGQGVVHRDVKPENILLAGSHALVADFGIARSSAVSQEGALTETGALIGTPYYMSPEQASGRSDVDGRSDQYSLACLLFELIAGEPPFTGDNLLAIVIQHTVDPAPALSSRRADVPGPVDAAVARALAKQPESRFPTIAAFLEALGTAGAILVQPAAPSVAVLPFVNLSSDREAEYFSDGLTEEIANALAKVPGLRVAARSAAFTFKGRDVEPREVGTRLRVTHVVEGSVRSARERVRVTVQIVSTADGFRQWSGTFDGTLGDIFALQDEVAQRVAAALGHTSHAGETPIVRPPTPVVAAYTLYLRGRHEAVRRTPEGLRAGMERFEQALALDPNFALAQAGVAECWTLLGFEETGDVPPLEAMPRAQVAVERLLDIAPELAEAHLWCGVIKLLFGYDTAGALRCLDHALALAPDHPFIQIWSGLALACGGRTDEAVARGLLAEQIDPITPAIQFAVGRLQYFAGQLEDALGRFQVCAEAEPAGLASAWLARALNLMGRPAEGLAALEPALVHSPHALHLEVQGVCLAALGKRNEALATVQELEEMARRRHISPTHQGTIYGWLGEADRALGCYREAARLRSGYFIFGSTLVIGMPQLPPGLLDLLQSHRAPAGP